MTVTHFSLSLLTLSLLALGAAASEAPPLPETIAATVEAGTCTVDRVENAGSSFVVVVEYPDGDVVPAPAPAFSRRPPEGLRFPCAFAPRWKDGRAIPVIR